MSAEQARTEADAGVAAGTAASADSEEKDVKIPVEDAVETADEKDDAPRPLVPRIRLMPRRRR